MRIGLRGYPAGRPFMSFTPMNLTHEEYPVTRPNAMMTDRDDDGLIDTDIGPEMPTRPKAVRFELTEVGNGRRLAARHAPSIRFCPTLGAWLAWDGKRWRRDATLEVERLAKETVDSMLAEAKAVTDAAQQRALCDWSLKSQTKHQINAMIDLARSEEGIAVPADRLDTDPWLFNCLNGTLDLRTGERRPHCPDDLITKLAPVAYDPDAACPTWEGFLRQVLGDDATIEFVRRAAGYGLTGETREHCLFFLHGAGRNGKSTMLKTLLAIVGDYGATIPASLLAAQDREQHSTGLADLRGRRIVAAAELEDGKRLAESLVKVITGGDRIRARRLYQDSDEFEPTHKLFMAGNHRPEVRGTDEGIWSRILVILFPYVIAAAERDKSLDQRLAGEAAGILAWMVRGCLDWQKDGLGVPESIASATGDYRAEMDDVEAFLDDRCVQEADARCRTTQLHVAYREWLASTSPERAAKSAGVFGQSLEAKGFKTLKTGGNMFRLGVRLIDESRRADVPQEERPPALRVVSKAS